jgi:hypothetical protein
MAALAGMAEGRVLMAALAQQGSSASQLHRHPCAEFWQHAITNCQHICLLFPWVAVCACGVQELVRLPVAPLPSNPEGVPGFALLLNSYTDRMDETMTQWYKSIVAQVRRHLESMQQATHSLLLGKGAHSTRPCLVNLVSGWRALSCAWPRRYPASTGIMGCHL